MEDKTFFEKMKRLSIIIPAFQASEYIKSTLSRIKEVFGSEAEIIIVINDDTNKTLSAIKELAIDDNNIRLLQFTERLGKGKAILEGFKVAEADTLGFIDADCPFDLKTLKEELGYLYSDANDCIIFSKWKGQTFKQVNQRFIRKCLSRIFNLLVRKLIGLDFVDTQGGAKFVKRKAFLRLGYEFDCSGFVFDVEMLKKLVANRARIKEVYLPYYKTELSTVNIFRDAVPVMRKLLRLRRKENERQNIET